MADEDKDKAEKLAAAKKRFEQLKKEQAKKGKKTGVKKKKEDDAAASTEEKTGDAAPADDSVEPAAADADKPADTAVDEDDPVQKEGLPEKPAQVQRQPSLSLQSKQRSESFRTGSSAPLSPGNEVTDLYRKQTSRIEELEKENKVLQQQEEEAAARLRKAEEELEGFREGSSDVAGLKSKAREADGLKNDVESLKRQLIQAQKDGAGKRRVSGQSPDLAKELESKTTTIESLELDVSGLRNQITVLQNTLQERDATVAEAEQRAQTAETATENTKKELDQLKVSMAFPSDETKAANEDPEALQKRISILESDLRTANTSIDAAVERAKSLEQKMETLTKMHKDVSTSSQAKDKELGELRSQLRKRDKPSHVRDASEFDLADEETELGSLHTRIRELEAENFDLRRGVWRERRASMQPGIDEHGQNGHYEDVDLNTPYTPGGRSRGSVPRSTFQDVLNSGISAFTGRSREGQGSHGAQGQKSAHDRKQSLGLLDEDEDFDAEAWQQAQEQEAKRRIERVKEVKRGLEQWRGWRVDLADMRRGGLGGGGRECGPVFDV